MRQFSPTTITIAGLLLALVEFAVGATELPKLVGETVYGIISLVLGAVGVVCTFILAAQVRNKPKT